MPSSVSHAFDGITQTGPTTYETTIPAIAAANYYSLAEYTLTGTVPGQFFSGDIQDVIKFKDVYIMLTSNGLWWSDTGFSGWTLVSGTAGVHYYYYVVSQGKLYTHNSATGYIEEIIVDANNSEYVYKSQIWATGLTGATAILVGNDKCLGVMQVSSSINLLTRFVSNGAIISRSYDITSYDPAYIFSNPFNLVVDYDGKLYACLMTYIAGSSYHYRLFGLLSIPTLEDDSTFTHTTYAYYEVNDDIQLTAYNCRVKGAVQDGSRVLFNHYMDTGYNTNKYQLSSVNLANIDTYGDFLMLPT